MVTHNRGLQTCVRIDHALVLELFELDISHDEGASATNAWLSLVQSWVQ